MPERFKQREDFMLSYLEGYRDGEVFDLLSARARRETGDAEGVNVFGAYLAGNRAARAARARESAGAAPVAGLSGAAQ